MAERSYKKIDDRTLAVVLEDGREVRFAPDFLRRQRRAVQAQRNRELARRDAELAEVDALLAACLRLNITAKGGPSGGVPLERLGAYADAMGYEPARPTGWQKAWAFLTRPRGLGQ